MIEHTFIHIQGIGEKTEKSLWRRGIRTWHDFLNLEGTTLSRVRDPGIRAALLDSIRHREEVAYFTNRLPPGEVWRLYQDFRDRAVFLDIETSGGYQGLEEITVIGLYDGKEVRSFVSGLNLAEFEMVIADFDLVITFNGTSFDLPLIRRFFPNITLPEAHIDLRFLLKRVGYRGGLKKIEKKVGIQREAAIAGMDGFDAVRLWNAYRWGDPKALDLLIRYNTADIIHLKLLLELACREMKARMLPWREEVTPETMR